MAKRPFLTYAESIPESASGQSKAISQLRGKRLNPHVRFHCVIIEGVLEAAGAGGARFHEARGVGPETVAEIQAKVRRRLLRVAARRGLLEREDAQAMGAWEHAGGF